MKKIAVLILAAGKASRFGSEKLLQMLPNGLTVIRHITDIVLNSGLTPVIVVTSLQAGNSIQQSLAGCKVHYYQNPAAELGISTSLQAGIRQISDDFDAALVVLGDQPFITSNLLLLLTAEYSKSQAQIVYPAVDGQRSNPVLLDRAVFSAIMELRGDTGARTIFPLFRCQSVDWPDRRLLLDIDAPEDLANIKANWDIQL